MDFLKIKNISVSDFFAALSILLIINPLNVRDFSPFFVIVALAGWLFMVALERRLLLKMAVSNKLFLFSCVYPALLMMYCITRDDIQFESRYILDMMCLLMVLYYLNLNNKEKIASSLKIAFGYLLIISSYTLVRLQFEKNIAREMASTNNAIDANPFTGGYGVVYSLVFICVALFSVIRIKKRTKECYVQTVLLFLVYVLFILFAQYAMAIILLIMGMLLVWIDKKLLAVLVGIFLLLLFSGGENIALFFYSMADLLPENTFIFTRTANKGDVVDGMIHGVLSSQTTFGTWYRFEIIQNSFDLIFVDPFWGIGNTSESAIGKHSTFLDALAGYGILLGGVYIITKLYILIYLRKFVKREFRYTYTVIILLFVLLMLVNKTSLNEFSLTLYYIVPFMLGASKENILNEGR